MSGSGQRPTASRVLFWRRTDVDGLERLELAIGPDGITAASTVVCLEDGGLVLTHRWRLDGDWRVRSVDVERRGRRGHGTLRLERAGAGWRVDGVARRDLDGADEPDLSATPFCNTFAIRRVPAAVGGSLTMDTAFIDAAALTVARSRQCYERLGATRLRYVDRGRFAGFEAELEVDADGLVERYEGLFERVDPAPEARS